MSLRDPDYELVARIRESQLIEQSQDIKTLEENYDALAAALTSIAKSCGTNWDSGYDEGIVVRLVASQSEALKAAEESSAAMKREIAETMKAVVSVNADLVAERDSLRSQLANKQEIIDGFYEMIKDSRSQSDALRSQLEAAQQALADERQECSRRGQSVFMLMGQLEAAQLVALRSHRWVGRQQGGSPSEAGSYEWVRYCSVCGMEDTCEDPLPPCPGASSALTDSVKPAAEAMDETKRKSMELLISQQSETIRELREALERAQRQLARDIARFEHHKFDVSDIAYDIEMNCRAALANSVTEAERE